MTNDSNCNVTIGNCSYTMPKHEEKHKDAQWFIVYVSTLTLLCLLIICGIILFFRKPPFISVRQRGNILVLEPNMELTGIVLWMKDGKEIEISKHKDKFTVNLNKLSIYNLTEEDGGSYQVVGLQGKTLAVQIVIETARLVGVETVFTDESRCEDNELTYLFEVDNVPCHIMIANVEKTTELKPMKNIFTGGKSKEEFEKLGVHAAILLGHITGGNSGEEYNNVLHYFPQRSASTDDENGAQRNTRMDISKKEVKDIEDTFYQPTSSVFDCVLYYCFIKNAATEEFLSRVFRTSGYVKEKNEKCVCLSPDFSKKLIERLSTDIILHKTISDASSHPIISEILRIPEEVLKWDHDARTRFVKKIGKDAVKIFSSRLMIVGCAGAGKTTLLKRLLDRNMDNLPETKSTVGLDIYESLFKISDEPNKLIAPGEEYHDKEEKTLSITDFAGQSAYYACHQVYLSRRALYILVIDMSKNPYECVAAKSEQNVFKETLFDNWTHKDYYRFWMESICTYCEANTEVILVGTHRDVISEDESKDKHRFGIFLSQLPEASQLQKHLSEDNYFEIGHPKDCRGEMERLEMCIINMIKKQSTWGEIVPKLWQDFDHELCNLKSKRLIRLSDLNESSNVKIPSEREDVLDMLRFFHDCGKILFFNEKGLAEMVILDVQWFVNAFRQIVTDQSHRPKVLQSQWEAFNKTGMLEEEHLKKIWEQLGLQEMIKYKDLVLSYMQRLGLMAKENGKQFYVPSVNKLELLEKDFLRIENAHHTDILKYRFPKFLPHFYFYRLVVASLEEYDAQIEKNVPLLFRNAAFLKYKDRYHRIVLGVSNTQIHLQIYTCSSKQLQRDITLKIRSKIESFLKRLTETFHKPVEYFPGYTCRPTKVTEEHEDSVFIRESEAMQHYLADPSESLSPCPEHDRNPHDLRWKTMLWYWKRRSELQDTCCQRLFSFRRPHQRSNKQMKWKKKDIDVEEGEITEKMI